MPRERIHWEILEQTCNLLTPQSPFLEILRAHTAFSALGAVAPDAPYYLERGTSEQGSCVAEFLHGTHGEDTFAPLRAWSKRIRLLPREAQGPAWAMWGGMLSHCIADQVFHPLVYWFTGDYYAPAPHQRSRARTRHRLLEVHLDTLITRSTLPTSIQAVYQAAAPQLPQLLSVFVPAIEESTAIPNQRAMWSNSFKDLARSQSIFLSPIAGFLARGATRLCNLDSFHEVDALFSWRRTTPPRVLQGALTYKNPVTAEEFRTTIADLCVIAATRTARELQGTEIVFGQAAPPEAPLSPHGGTSLSFGIWGASASDARHFSSTGLDIDGLRQ